MIENQSVRIPGSVSTFDLRAQDPHGPFGGPMLSLVGGQYPATANQIVVTSGVAAGFKLSTGSHWTVAAKTWKVTGIVQDPENLAASSPWSFPARSPPLTRSRSCSTRPAPRPAASVRARA